MKFEVTEIEHVSIPGVYRVRALRDIERFDVVRGDLGGFVAAEENLSHEGDCWVGGDAVVRDCARVEGDALVAGEAEVEGEAVVAERARVLGRALVGGKARIRDCSQVVGDGAMVIDEAQVLDRASIEDGVFVGGGVVVGGEVRVTGKSVLYGDARVGGGWCGLCCSCHGMVGSSGVVTFSVVG